MLFKWNNPAFQSLVIAAAALVLGFILYKIVSYILLRWLKKLSFISFKINLHLLQPSLISLIPAFCLRSALPFMDLPEGPYAVLSNMVTLWLIASFGWLAITFVHLIRDIITGQYDITISDNLRARSIHTQIRVIENIIKTLIVLLTISLMLITFESVRQVGVSLIASAGIMGIVMGFAAQKTLGNFIAGIQLAFTQPIRVDDVLVVEGEWGRVEEITLTYVVLRIWDLRRLILPISYFIEQPFQNWTRVSADILGSVFIYADYTVPIEDLRQELTRILENNDRWDKKVNVLQVTNANEHTVEIRALMSAKDSSTAWDLRCEVREKLILFLREKLPGHLPRSRVVLEPEGRKSALEPKDSPAVK